MCRKADDAGVLSPGKEDNTAARKISSKDECIFKLSDYKYRARSLPRNSRRRRGVQGLPWGKYRLLLYKIPEFCFQIIVEFFAQGQQCFLFDSGNI